MRLKEVLSLLKLGRLAEGNKALLIVVVLVHEDQIAKQFELILEINFRYIVSLN